MVGTVYIEKRTGGTNHGRYYFTSPAVQMMKKLPMATIAFPQFHGETNMDPEAFATMGWKQTYQLTFEIIEQTEDQSNGYPGSINTVKEQIQHLEDTMFRMEMEDYHHFYCPEWYDSYKTVVVSELAISQEPGAMSAKGSISFEYCRNPLG